MQIGNISAGPVFWGPSFCSWTHCDRWCVASRGSWGIPPISANRDGCHSTRLTTRPTPPPTSHSARHLGISCWNSHFDPANTSFSNISILKFRPPHEEGCFRSSAKSFILWVGGSAQGVWASNQPINFHFLMIILKQYTKHFLVRFGVQLKDSP